MFFETNSSSLPCFPFRGRQGRERFYIPNEYEELRNTMRTGWMDAKQR